MGLLKRVREAAAASAAPELLREDATDGTAEDVLGDACAECKGTGMSESGSLCTVCEGGGGYDMQESTSGPYWVYSDDPQWESLREASRTFSSDVRKKYAASGIAMPDGSYPIPDKDALSRAVSSYGHNPTSAVKAHIKKRARALSASDTLPEDWQGSQEADSDGFGGKKAPPFGKSKESETVMARLDALEGQVGLFKQLKEAKPASMTPAFSVPGKLVTTAGGQQGYPVILIREGKGNQEDDQWYNADAIQEMCESGVCEGMQAYGNHPDLEEEELRPERDVKELVGTYHDVKFVHETGKPARAEAIFVPLTLNEDHPRYGWVVTLAEAAANSTAPQPICGISLYGLSAGDDCERPDGSYGRMVSMIRPSSGDIVTNAGAGGGFIRQVMESARRAALRNKTPKELSPMKALEYQTKFRETAKRVREAASDEDREQALKEMEALEAEKIDSVVDLSIEHLREAAPSLVKDIEDSAKAEGTETLEAVREENSKLKEHLSQFTEAINVTGALREAGVEDPVELRHYAHEVRKLGLRESAEIKDYVESERKFEERRREQDLEKLREALGGNLEEIDIEGNVGRIPVMSLPTDGGEEALRESGLPLISTEAA